VNLVIRELHLELLGLNNSQIKDKTNWNFKQLIKFEATTFKR
jgi:hypothetical protein